MKLKFPIILLLSFFILLTSACSSGEKKIQDNTEDVDEMSEKAHLDSIKYGLLDMHDEVMPLMADIHRLIDSIETSNLGFDEETKANMIQRLDEAGESMMDWMAGYDEPDKELSFEAKETYLLEQEKAINKVAKDMLSSIRDARKLLRNE